MKDHNNMCFLREKVPNEYKDPEKTHMCDCYQPTCNQHYRLHSWFSANSLHM